ncbi:MAG: DUF4911 domain-containing protein [Syntrophales bacterium]|nr:DUF4911 domain-containing protein [Syntrophales bacterium]
MMKSRLKLPRRMMAYFQLILESYEGIFAVTTEDADAGIMIVTVPPGLCEDGDTILRELRKEIPYEDVSLNVER